MDLVDGCVRIAPGSLAAGWLYASPGGQAADFTRTMPAQVRCGNPP